MEVELLVVEAHEVGAGLQAFQDSEATAASSEAQGRWEVEEGMEGLVVAERGAAAG